MILKLIRARRKARRDQFITEIIEVKRVLASQGFHPRVSAVVARWFKSKGLSVTKYKDRFWVEMKTNR